MRLPVQGARGPRLHMGKHHAEYLFVSVPHLSILSTSRIMCTTSYERSEHRKMAGDPEADSFKALWRSRWDICAAPCQSFRPCSCPWRRMKQYSPSCITSVQDGTGYIRATHPRLILLRRKRIGYRASPMVVSRDCEVSCRKRISQDLHQSKQLWEARADRNMTTLNVVSGSWKTITLIWNKPTQPALPHNGPALTERSKPRIANSRRPSLVISTA